MRRVARETDWNGVGLRRVWPWAGLFGGLALGGLAIVAMAEAAETVVDRANVREPEVRRSVPEETARRASEWGVSTVDVERYDELMRGRRGVWSPGADPLVVLGAHARSDDERRRLAEAFVRAERERVDGELEFERAVQAAWQRLYGDEPRVGGGAGVAQAPPSRFAVVVERTCDDCRMLVRKYLGRGAPVDLYVVGAGGDDDLRAWVGEQGVDVAAIRAGRVTVNHGDGGVGSGRVPSAWAQYGGAEWEAVE